MLNYILSNVGILLPIYACDLIYAIFEYKKPQVQYIRLNIIIFQEFYNWWNAGLPLMHSWIFRQLIINDVSEGGIIQMSEHGSTGVKPLIMDLEELDISYVDEKFATLNLRFTVSNPNYKSVILQFVKYEIIESGSSIHTGQIGERYDGFITSSNYFTILGEGSTSLSDTITLRSAYNEVELWESIASGDLNWQVKGQAYYSLSSMTAGGENIMDFVLTP